MNNYFGRPGQTNSYFSKGGTGTQGSGYGAGGQGTSGTGQTAINSFFPPKTQGQGELTRNHKQLLREHRARRRPGPGQRLFRPQIGRHGLSLHPGPDPGTGRQLGIIFQAKSAPGRRTAVDQLFLGPTAGSGGVQHVFFEQQDGYRRRPQ